MKQNGITHVIAIASPCHLSTNRLGKRAVQTFKYSMKKFTESHKLSHFLFHYHLTPQTTGQSPAELYVVGKMHKSMLGSTPINSETQSYTKSLTLESQS